ncbi:hypothetical protein [Fertoeibacter niger]
MIAGSWVRMLKKLNDLALGTPSADSVVISAMGRGTTVGSVAQIS